MKPDYAEAHAKLGNVLMDLEQHDEAIASYLRALELEPEYAEAHHNLGVALKVLERRQEAIAHYRRALELEPDYVDAHYNLANALQDIERHEEAIASYRRTLQINPDHAGALNNLGNSLQYLNRHDEAIASYRRALEIEPDFVEACYNLGNVFQDLNRHEEAVVCYRRALQINPVHAGALNNLGNVLKYLERYEEAITCYRRVVEIKPDHAGTHNNLGNALQDIGRHEDAIASFQRALELDPDHGNALSMLAVEKRRVCDWVDNSDLERRLRHSLKTGSQAIDPFVLLAFADDPFELLQCARKYCAEKTGSITAFDPAEARDKDGRIRLAYLSADFHEHATTRLMAELFRLHDRNKFELHAISFGPKQKSVMRTRLENAFDYWHEVQAMSDREAACLIRETGIEIAVDLKGYTKASRPGILAYKPAPIQVNYLGHPGTMGADFMDYILVDSVIVPADQQASFTEQLVHLPNSYQVNATTRAIAEQIPSRAECGLPETGFVFCCFNNTWKITPTVFDLWCRLLKKVPDSVFWLFGDNQLAEENLRREAAQRGVSPERLTFASRKPQSEHLARYRQADLFLDTLPCNAHTTASDALWAGLPLITCTGRSFHARVAGSPLQAVGLPELVTTDLSDYEALALKLAHERELLAN
jgi:predicted O-linked N-acetylglucosamine transferase (SPINDLY family)